LIRYRAAWILPVSRPPLEGGVITVDNDRIVSVDAESSGPVEDLGRVAVLPGLVNAHTHLELSWMRGRVPPASTMPEWVGGLMALRRTMARDPRQPIVAAIEEAHATGTCLVGDITNTLASYEPLADADMYAAVFRELIGFGAREPDRLVDAALADACPPRAILRLAGILPGHRAARRSTPAQHSPRRIGRGGPIFA
jgi:cytosine/adenosine deaminase-related metal-dependent hydrolase